MGTPNDIPMQTRRPRPALGRALALAGSLVIAAAAPAAAQRAVVFVRHAEKADQSQDALLSAEGVARARALADLLRGAGVTHIITTEYRRTQSTARPLADALAITPTIVAARDLPTLVRQVRGYGPDAVVLVVGHSNTVPRALSAFGWPNTIDLHDRDYDDVFVLVPRGEGRGPTVVRLKYGRRTS
jgi:broad specificity phosphatase PhoE